MLNEDVRDSVLLVFSNRQDPLNALDAAEMTDKLGLQSFFQQWFFQVYRATMGDRLYEGLDCLLASLQKMQLAIALWRSDALLP